MVKQEVHERPGDNLIGEHMSGVVIWYVHERPALSKIACEQMSVWTKYPKFGFYYIFHMFKGEMSDSFTNYNFVGNTKVSVSIKKTYANKCTLSEIFLTEILKSFSVF